MLRTTFRAALTPFAMSVALIVAACNSSTPPTPSPVAPTAAPASIAPSAAPVATPNPTPAASPSQAAIGPGAWAATGAMLHGHSYGATATVLQDGRVLVTGGEDDNGSSASAGAELFDPTTGTWTATRKMFERRRGQVATLLSDGRVLVTGGWDYSSEPARFGELFDPKTETWTKTSPMTRWRYAPEATMLADGRVLVAGGETDCGCSTRRAEIYDPKTDRWTATRNMPTSAGLATLLDDGRVLVLSGDPWTGEARTAQTIETFDPSTGRWRTIEQAPTDVRWGTAVRLENGNVLFLNSQLAKGGLYDPTANTWATIDVPHTGGGPAAVLQDGSVLVVGKVSSARFDPFTGAWSAVARPPMIRDYALDSIDGVELNLMAELRDGRVLATSFGSAAIYDPTAGS
jgi:hypothetical protein